MASIMTVYDLLTETVAIITGMLPMRDLRNLRLTCRWAENEVCIDFARRGYKSVHLPLHTKNLRHFSHVLKSPKIAAAIQTLRLGNHDKIGKAKIGITSTPAPDPAEEKIKLLDLFAMVPNLATVKLH